MNAMIYTKSGKKFHVHNLEKIIFPDHSGSRSEISSDKLDEFQLSSKDDMSYSFFGTETFTIKSEDLECILFDDPS